MMDFILAVASKFRSRTPPASSFHLDQDPGRRRDMPS